MTRNDVFLFRDDRESCSVPSKWQEALSFIVVRAARDNSERSVESWAYILHFVQDDTAGQVGFFLKHTVSRHDQSRQ